MKEWIRLSFFVIVIVFCAGLTHPQGDAFVYAQPTQKNLGLFIFGKAGTQGFSKLFETAHESLGNLLAANGFDREGSQIFFSENPKSARGNYQCDRGSLESNISLAAKQGPYHQVFLFMAGHANGRDDDAVFHLPGQDILYSDLISLIKQIRAEQWVVVIAAPQGQSWVKEFSGSGNIVIVGNAQRQFDFIPVQFLIQFPLMFEKAADWHEKNTVLGSEVRSVSLAEVFFMTARSVHRWYSDNHLLETEEPVLEANGDGKAIAVGQNKPTSSLKKQDILEASSFWIKEAEPAHRVLYSMSVSGGTQS